MTRNVCYRFPGRAMTWQRSPFQIKDRNLQMWTQVRRSPKPTTVCAIGFYHRRELCPCGLSDLGKLIDPRKPRIQDVQAPALSGTACFVATWDVRNAPFPILACAPLGVAARHSPGDYISTARSRSGTSSKTVPHTYCRRIILTPQNRRRWPYLG